jgi:hypothetical protein
MKTIARNATKKIAAIKAEYTECYAYTLENHFAGVMVTNVDWVWTELNRFSFAKLHEVTRNGEQAFQIRVHSNCWYELRKPKS